MREASELGGRTTGVRVDTWAAQAVAWQQAEGQRILRPGEDNTRNTKL